MQYPHWLMVAGAVLVVLGFIGFPFRQNRNDEPDSAAVGSRGGAYSSGAAVFWNRLSL
jgi:hypothetical protein